MQSKARVDEQEQHVAFLKTEREKRSTKAPFTGFVVEEHTNIGQWLSKSAVVVTLAQLTEVEVEVQIDQQYIDQIVRDVLSFWMCREQEAEMKVAEMGGVVDTVVPRSNWKSGSRSFPVIVQVKNEIDESTSPPVPALREGMMAEATFRGEPIDGYRLKTPWSEHHGGHSIVVINPSEEGKRLSVRQVLAIPESARTHGSRLSAKDLAGRSAGGH